jgi:hypothetical protein
VRDSRQDPLSKTELEEIKYLVDEWSHAKFISIHEYVDLFERCCQIHVVSDDWTMPTLPSWPESVLKPLRKPRELVRAEPIRFWKLVREAYTFLRLEAAFRKGLCQCGLIYGLKNDGFYRSLMITSKPVLYSCPDIIFSPRQILEIVGQQRATGVRFSNISAPRKI